MNSEQYYSFLKELREINRKLDVLVQVANTPQYVVESLPHQFVGHNSTAFASDTLPIPFPEVTP